VTEYTSVTYCSHCCLNDWWWLLLDTWSVWWQMTTTESYRPTVWIWFILYHWSVWVRLTLANTGSAWFISFYSFLDWSSRQPCLVCPSALQLCVAAAENDVSLWTCSFVCPTRLPWTCIIIWDTSFTAKSSTTTLATSMKTHLVNRMCLSETHCSLTEVYQR